ncbi:MAG: pyridoxal phosphate-dependent aminotransferase [Spirochaetales bacterium]|nr:pyridoxal phosphate-dependent aminotransferase [Spirochaetales bacterium]
METNALQRALEQRKSSGKPWVNLIDSDFHANGFLPDIKGLTEDAARYFASRRYSPDPRGSLEARQAIVEYYAERGMALNPEQMLLTAGSSESYSLLFSQLADPGDRILLPLPGYPLFEDLAGYVGLEPDFYPLERSLEWQPDLEVLEALIQPTTRFLVLISPNNPCGSVLGTEVLGSILSLAKDYDLAIIWDEVFGEFLQFPDRDGVSSSVVSTGATMGAPVLPPFSPTYTGPPIFLINGISKLCASPDLKLSWIGGINLPKVWNERLELAYDTYLSCSSLSQFLLPGLLHRSLEPGGVTGKIQEVLRVNANTFHRLTGIAWGGGRKGVEGGIHRILPLGDGREDEATALELVNRQGIYTHPGYLYGMEDDSTLVISLLKEPAVFEETLGRLVKHLD